MAKKNKYLEVTIKGTDGVNRHSLYNSINQITKELGISRTTINRSLNKTAEEDKWVKGGTVKFEWTNKAPSVSVDDNQPVGILIEHDGVKLRIVYNSISECSKRWGVSRYQINKSIESGSAVLVNDHHGEVNFFKKDKLPNKTLKLKTTAIIKYMVIQRGKGRNIIPIDELLGYGLIDNIYLPICTEILELWHTGQIEFHNNNTYQLKLVD